MNKVTQDRKLEAEELEKRAAPSGVVCETPDADGCYGGDESQPGGSDGHRTRVWRKTPLLEGGGGGDGPEPPTYTDNDGLA